MATFAHINGGYVMDPRIAESVDAYKALFPPATVEEWSGDEFQEVPGGTKHNAKDDGQGGYEDPEAEAPKRKTTGLTYDEFRKCFTIAELTLLDSFEVDAYVESLNLTALTVTQKANVRFFISEAIATGAGPTGINLGSPKMNLALTAMVAYGAFDETRKAEIIAGIQKS